VTVAKTTFMVLVATLHVPLHARLKPQQVEVYVNKVMESVFMAVLIVSMVYSVPRTVQFIAALLFVIKTTAHVQKVAKQE
jgi:hypothetical protein